MFAKTQMFNCMFQIQIKTQLKSCLDRFIKVILKKQPVKKHTFCIGIQLKPFLQVKNTTQNHSKSNSSHYEGFHILFPINHSSPNALISIFLHKNPARPTSTQHRHPAGPSLPVLTPLLPRFHRSSEFLCQNQHSLLISYFQ